jgi:shikimate kinase
MTLVLIGFKNAGKSRLGKLAARAAGAPFIDTDRIIEQLYHETTGKLLGCREIFHTSGEKLFRVLERKAILSITFEQPKIIALGGGALTNPGALDHLKEGGARFIYLKMTKREAEKRMFYNGVPLFLDPKDPHASFRYVWSHREPLFAQAADVVLEIAKYDEEAIVRFLKNLYHATPALHAE